MTRKEKSRVVLEQFDIPFWDADEVINEQEAVLRSPHDIAKRAIACLFTLQIAGDMYYGNDVRESKAYFLKLLQDFEAVEYLTPNENRFVFETPNKEDALECIWQYEACQILLWSLGLIRDIDFPDQLCDSKLILGTILRFESFDALMKHINPLPLSVILDETDIVCRMDYACTKARTSKQEMPSGISHEILHERKRALLWLIQGEERYDIWDEEIL